MPGSLGISLNIGYKISNILLGFSLFYTLALKFRSFFSTPRKYADRSASKMIVLLSVFITHAFAQESGMGILYSSFL